VRRTGLATVVGVLALAVGALALGAVGTGSAWAAGSGSSTAGAESGSSSAAAGSGAYVAPSPLDQTAGPAVLAPFSASRRRAAAPRARQAQAGPPTAGYRLGSDLRAAANKIIMSGQDWVAWIAKKLGFRQVGAPINDIVAPADGQILSFSVKGMAVPNGQPGDPGPHNINGGTTIHLVDLVPQADGSVRIAHASGPFNMPDSGDPQQVSTFYPENFCVGRGDFLGFASEGGFDPGFYPQGVPFRVFSDVSGTTTDFYTKHGGVVNGAQFAPQSSFGNLELLMQAIEGTGGYATPLCPGGTAGTSQAPPGQDPLTVLNQETEADGTLRFTFVLAAGDSVTGTASVGQGAHHAAVTARARVYGRGSVTATTTGPVTLGIKPTRKGRRLFKHRSTISVAVHLSFRSSASLGSTGKTKDFRVKIHGKGKKH
jgi:hypothetical protein